MRQFAVAIAASIAMTCAASSAEAAILIGGSTNNGNLDLTYAQEIVPGFFLPKPQVWVNIGTRALAGPYEDEMSSEPWAGPAPTPVTTDGNLNPPPPGGCGGPDCAVFFKPFSGNTANGAATGHLYQDVAGTPGVLYTMTGWAGAEPNALMGGAEFAIEFLGAGDSLISSVVLNLLPTLFIDNDEPFDYKQYTLMGVAPVGTLEVRIRASMISAMSNPAGGGQAFVVDDFTLTSDTSSIPEPGTLALLSLGLAGLVVSRRRKQ